MTVQSTTEFLDFLRVQTESGKKVGVALGSFPLIHAGTVRFLRAARAQCDVLVALVAAGNAEEAADKPLFLKLEERRRVLAAFQEVGFAAIAGREGGLTLDECRAAAPKAVWMQAAAENDFPPESPLRAELESMGVRLKNCHSRETCTSAEVLRRMARPAVQ